MEQIHILKNPYLKIIQFSRSLNQLQIQKNQMKQNFTKLQYHKIIFYNTSLTPNMLII
jgi:hypothetical protein